MVRALPEESEMQIEELDGPSKYETMPTDGTLYLSAIHYTGIGWMNGPGGTNKSEIVKQLRTWSGIDAARIYAVKVPLQALPAA